MRRYSRVKRRTRRKARIMKGGSATTPTFHVLLCTGGKPELKAMIDSLKDELLEGDAMTIVFDGPDALKKSTYTDEWVAGSKCQIKKIEENPALGFWGHGARNKYQGQLTPRTTYIMNADDDDTYIAGSFAKLRAKCVDPNTLYIAKMTYANNRTLVIPRQNKEIIFTDISTQNGIIPFDIAAKGEWKPKYGGDYDYYSDLKKLNPPIEFLDDIIYLKDVKGVQGGGGVAETSAVCAIMIKEEKYVDEWIQYYLYGLGFTKLYIYDNSDENNLKDLPKKYPNVVVVHFPGKVKQLAAYNDWLTKNRALPEDERIKWCALFDTDEFLVLKKHANITDFLREYCKDGAVGINWYFYGDSHLQNYSPEPVTKRFTWRQSNVDRHIKSIMNCEDVESITEFHGIGSFKQGKYNKDTAGKVINGPFNPNGPSDVAVINHYIVKTREEHAHKKNRGRANTTNPNNLRTNGSFNAQNYNEVLDDSAYKIYMKAQENMTSHKTKYI